MSILQTREKDGTVNIQIAGKVSQDPRYNQKGDRINFSVMYGKNKFMNCQAYADTPAGFFIGFLEKGDHVLLTGIYEEWEREGKKYSALKVDFATVQPAPQNDTVIPDSQEHSAAIDGQFTELEEEGNLPF